MLKLRGVGAAPGVARGPAHLFGWRIEVKERRIGGAEVAAEMARLATAVATADGQLQRIQQQIADQEGARHQHYEILEAHRMMLKDPHLADEARRMITEDHCGAEWAVRRALNQIRAVFDRIEDPYFRERGSDIDAVGERLLRNLLEAHDVGSPEIPAGSIVYGHDLSPADLTHLARLGAAGFFTEAGGKTSHSAVVARALGLPLVVGVAEIAHHVRADTPIIVDGSRGEVILYPDQRALDHYESRSQRQRAREQRLTSIREEPAETLDGVRVHLAANVELLQEVPVAIELGAESVGLFRTEFLYLERNLLPSEEEQYNHIVSALRVLGGRMVTLRTLDLGGDKMPASLNIPVGANPALGLRSIRYSLWQKDVFKTQLRALYRAAAVGPLRILFPMISGVSELRAAKYICNEVCAELADEGLAHDPKTPLGVMVETPSAAMMTDLLGAECDFLSIGTNDLIQYALAADRQDENVGYLYRPLHPAVIRILRAVVQGARQAGKPLAMCGDMAGDPLFLWVLLGIGLRDLSMAPRQIPAQKSVIRKTRIADAELLVASAEKLATEEDIEALVMEVMGRSFPDLGEAESVPIAP